MLNYLLSVVLLSISTLGFFVTHKVNRIEHIFQGINITFLSNCVKEEPYYELMYFDKDIIVDLTTYYFNKNLQNVDYSLTFSFREEDKTTVISDTPNIIQIDLEAKVIFNFTFKINSRFVIDGREVSKDWFTTT